MRKLLLFLVFPSFLCAQVQLGKNVQIGGSPFQTLTTTDTSGAATLTGGVLNIPQYQGSLTLTTTGTSGAATLSGNVLNIPQYAGGISSLNGLTGALNLTSSDSSVSITPSGTSIDLKAVGTVANQTDGVLPLATGPTSIGAKSHINENTPGFDTFTQSLSKGTTGPLNDQVVIDPIWNRIDAAAGTPQTTCGGEATVLQRTNAVVLSVPSTQTVFAEWCTLGSNLLYFESLDGITNWTAYSGNPVLANYNRSRVTVDTSCGGAYCMYAVPAPAYNQIDEYGSSDGVHWTLFHAGVLTLGSGGAWDSGSFGSMGVLKNGSEWMMAYEAAPTGGDFQVGTATSTDNIHWAKSGSNPEIGTQGQMSVSRPWIWYDSATSLYWMWAHCSYPVVTPIDLPTEGCRFESSDFTTWSQNPVYSNFPRTTYLEGAQKQDGQIADFDLLPVSGGGTYIYYTAASSQDCSFCGVMVATSPLSLHQIVGTDEGATVNNSLAYRSEIQGPRIFASGSKFSGPSGQLSSFSLDQQNVESINFWNQATTGRFVIGNGAQTLYSCSGVTDANHGWCGINIPLSRAPNALWEVNGNALTDGDQTVSGNFYLIGQWLNALSMNTLTAATSGANQSPYPFYQNGKYWTGSSSQQSGFTQIFQFGTGANPSEQEGFNVNNLGNGASFAFYVGGFGTTPILQMNQAGDVLVNGNRIIPGTMTLPYVGFKTYAGTGTPSDTCSATVNTGAIAVNATPTAYQCSNATGSYAWNTLGGGGIANAVTFNSSGGASPNTSYNGSAPVTVDYHTLGAAAALGNQVDESANFNPTCTSSHYVSASVTATLPSSVSTGCVMSFQVKSGFTLTISSGTVTYTGPTTVTGPWAFSIQTDGTNFNAVAQPSTSTHQWSCQPGLGDGTNAITAATYLQTSCKNTTGSTVTITGIQCYADAGTPTMNVTNGAGTGLLTGAVTCTSSYAAGTQSGTTTLANGDYLKFTFVAGGTAKQTSWVVQGTY